MNKKDQITLIWVLAAASVLLLLLYSPWGSPDLYNNRVYFADNQSVNFDTRIIGKQYMEVGNIRGCVGSLKANVSSLKASVGSLKTILNAPKNGNIGDGENPEIKVEDNYSKRKHENSPVNYNASTSSSSRIATYKANSKSESNKLSNASFSSNSSSAINNVNGGNTSRGITASASNRINNSNGGIGSALQTANLVSLNIDLSLVGDTTTLQGMSELQRAGSDPGDEPIGGTVPVPDGWLFLIFLATIYILIKQNLISKLFTKLTCK